MNLDAANTARFTLTLDGDGYLWRRDHGDSEQVWIQFAFESSRFGGDNVFALQQPRIDRIELDMQHENTAADYLRNLELQHAIYQSAAEGRRVLL